MTNGDSRTRRSVLRLTAASTGVALVAGCGGPGGTDDEPETEEGTGNGQDREGDEVVDDENETIDNQGNETDGADANETGGDNETDNG